MPEKNLKFDSKHANCNNPNNHQYWIDRGYSGRPENWKELYKAEGKITSSKNRQALRDSYEFEFYEFDHYGY